MRKWFLEIVQDFDGRYYCNLTIDGERIKGLPEYVDYKTLSAAIRERTGICIVQRKCLIFRQSGRKKYAYIDATQPLKRGCIVTLDEMRAGHKPNFNRNEGKSEAIRKFSNRLCETEKHALPNN